MGAPNHMMGLPNGRPLSGIIESYSGIGFAATHGGLWCGWDISWWSVERTLDGEYASLGHSLISNVRVLLSHANHHTLRRGGGEGGGEVSEGEVECPIKCTLMAVGSTKQLKAHQT